MSFTVSTATDGRAVTYGDERHSTLSALPGQPQLELPFRLTGSQRKTAFALRKNCEDMIAGTAKKRLVDVEYNVGTELRETKIWIADKPDNLHCTGFLTLTVGEYHCPGHGKGIPKPGTRCACPDCGQEMTFKQVWDASEASRRINNLRRRVLEDLFEKAIVVTERHANGAVHFHIVGILKGRPDIRSGLNFDAVKRGDYRSASEELRAMWANLRDVLPRYGFGRAELLPVEKTGEAVACYVSKYIEKNICNRLKEDRRKKLVRYIGWEKQQLKPNSFGWATKRATAWRCKAREVSALVNIYEPEQAAKAMGPRWAYHLTELIRKVDDATLPFMMWTFGEREVCRKELGKIIGHEEVKRAHDRMRYNFEIAGLTYERKEFFDYWESWPTRTKMLTVAVCS